MDKKQVTNFFVGIGVGLLIGGITAILLTPISGKELRIKLHDKVGELKDRGQRAIHPEKYSRIKQ